MTDPTDHRSGFVAVVGRPNAGKSTLINAMVGEKVSITSSQPQTTRRIVRGVVNRPSGQLILVDTPGVHRPRTLLGERLNDEAQSAAAEVDVRLLTIPADEAIGPGDRFIAENVVATGSSSRVVVVTKTDKVNPDQVMTQLVAAVELGRQSGFEWDEVVPVSATTGVQVDHLVEVLLPYLPAGPPLYPPDARTDLSTETWIAELIREAALEGVREELPHSIAVAIEEIAPRLDRPPDRPLTDVYANLFVERDSQKAIVIGPKGARLKRVGSTAREQIERVIGTPVYLDLRVRVAKDWQRDPRQLRKLGY